MSKPSNREIWEQIELFASSGNTKEGCIQILLDNDVPLKKVVMIVNSYYAHHMELMRQDRLQHLLSDFSDNTGEILETADLSGSGGAGDSETLEERADTPVVHLDIGGGAAVDYAAVAGAAPGELDASAAVSEVTFTAAISVSSAILRPLSRPTSAETDATISSEVIASTFTAALSAPRGILRPLSTPVAKAICGAGSAEGITDNQNPESELHILLSTEGVTEGSTGCGAASAAAHSIGALHLSYCPVSPSFAGHIGAFGGGGSFVKPKVMTLAPAAKDATAYQDENATHTVMGEGTGEVYGEG